MLNSMRTLFLILILPVALFAHDLVDIQMYQPKIMVDFRYASADNYLGMPLYPMPTLYVNRYVAHRLGRVQYDLAKEGLGLIIYEGYRPPAVQALIENKCCPDCLPRYREEASHYRKGLGVDVTIYYLDGQGIELPTEYDAKTPKAYRDYANLACHVYHNSAMLEKIMERYGFVAMREKWWHFDLKGYEDAPDLNIDYQELIEHPAPRWE